MKKNRSRKAVTWLPFVGISLVYLIIRSKALIGIPPNIFGDSGDYLRAAGLSVFDPEFYGGGRPMTYPLFCRFLDSSPVAIARVQWLAASACWIGLGAFLAVNLKTKWLKVASFAVLLAFSLTTEIVQWDTAVLSESLSVSFAVALSLAWLLLIRNWSRRNLAFLLVLTFFFLFLRDPNPYIVFALALWLVGTAIVKKTVKRYLPLSVVLFVLFGLSAVSLELGHRRWMQPFYNVIGTRILVSPERTEYFKSIGMPMSPALKERTGKLAGMDHAIIFHDPRLEGFRQWVLKDGKKSYVKFLLSHPDAWTKNPWHDYPVFIAPDLDGYWPRGFKPLLPQILAKPLYLRNPYVIAIWLLGLFAGTVYLAAKGKWQNTWLVPIALLVSSPPFGVLIWLGDAGEAPRHLLQIAVHLHLGLWLLTFFLLDAAATQLRGRHFLR